MYELLEDMIGNAINIFFDLDYNFYNFLNDTFLYIIFAVILIFGRQFRVYEGFEYASHIAALISGGFMAYLLYKYPTGEYLQEIKHNG